MQTCERQLDFDFGAELVQTTPAPKVEGSTIDEQFASFHSLNPHVYRAIVAVARRYKRQGKTRISMKGLFEFFRITYGLRTVGDDEYQLNNNYTSRYARLVMTLEPDLKGFFELRALAEERHG